MKVCIDARSLGYAGIQTYASCLLKALIEIDHENEYLVLWDRSAEWNLIGARRSLVPPNNPVKWLLWSNTKLSNMLARERIQVYHSLKHVTAFAGKSRKIATFHSARFFIHPRHYKWYDFTYWRVMYPAAARRYDCIITVSEAEKRNYVKYIDVPESKFKVIHLAADKRFHLITDSARLEETKRKFHLPDQFILFVGRLLPVKNIDGIIKAYHLARKQRELDHKLVIVGKESWYSKRLHSLVSELELTSEVVFTGPIFDELPCVYNLADLFVFPSHYEAFPAVPLEAMSCGTPVVASNSGGVPEAVGDAAMLVSATDIGECADAMIQVLSSDRLRRSMIEKGLARQKRFSWNLCAQEHRKIYEEMGLV